MDFMREFHFSVRNTIEQGLIVTCSIRLSKIS